MARSDEAPATPLAGPELDAWLARVAQWHTPSQLAAPAPAPASVPPHLVPRTATPLGGPALADAFAAGHHAATGRRLDKRLGETALAIIGVENAGGRAIIQYNWGNYSCTPTTWSGPMWETPSPQPGQPLYFRGYSSHAAGCEAWWRLMYRGRHRAALQCAARGRADQMVDALYASSYVVGGSQRGYRRSAMLFAEQYRRERLFGRFPFLLGSASDYIGASALVVGGAVIGFRWRDTHAR